MNGLASPPTSGTPETDSPGMAFASDGTLYAVTGDGGGVPESLFTLSTIDASSTLIMELGSGSDGETLAFNPDDGLLYHASGIGTPNNPNGEKFETVDPDTLAVTNVPLSGFDYEELTALSFLDGGFFAGDLGNAAFDDPGFFRISTGGVVTFLGDMDHVSKGFVLVHEPTPTPTASPTPTPTATPMASPTDPPTATPTALPTTPAYRDTHGFPDHHANRDTYGFLDHPAHRDTYIHPNSNPRAGCNSSTGCWRNWAGIPREAPDA